MASLNRLLVLLSLAVLFPAVAAAQNPPVSKTAPKTPSASIHIPSRLPELLPARVQASNDRAASRQTTAKPKRHVMGFAIAAGIGAGVGVAGVAASKYGENEGTSCAQCFVQWSAIAMPIGAGVGAVVGYLIDRARD